jgi:hypothetical protein
MTDPHAHPATAPGPAVPVYPDPTAFPPPTPPLTTTEALIQQRNAADAAAAQAASERDAANAAAEQAARERDAARRETAARRAAPPPPPRPNPWYTSGRGLGGIIIAVAVVVLLLLCLFGGWGKYVFQKLGLTVPVVSTTAPAVPGAPAATSPAATPDDTPGVTPAGAGVAGVPANWVRLGQAQYNEACARRYGANSTAGRIPGSSEWPSYQQRCDGALQNNLYLTEDYCQPHFGLNSRAENPYRASKDDSLHPWDTWYCIPAP